MKIPIYFIFLLLLFSFAYAEPPFEPAQSSTGTGLIIEHPSFSIYPLGNISLHFHIHNATGFVTTEPDCLIHLYNQTQKHLFEGDLDLDGNGLEYDISFPQSYFKLGESYQYFVYCNTSTQAGFYSAGFLITKNGNEPESHNVLLGIIILIPIILALMLLLGSLGMNDKHSVFKIGIFLFIIPAIWASFYLAGAILTQTLGQSTLLDAVSLLTNITGWIFFAIVSYFAIYGLYLLLKGREKNKQEELEY